MQLGDMKEKLKEEQEKKEKLLSEKKTVEQVLV